MFVVVGGLNSILLSWPKMLLRTVYPLLAAIFCDAVSAKSLKVVDLTHEQGPSTIYWPGNPEYNFTTLSRGLADGGYWYENNKFQTGEHGGTHVDAPSHFFKDAAKLHQIPMKTLLGPGAVINVTKQASKDPDYRVTVDDIRRWESKHGRLAEGAVVIMNSGWHKKYPNKTLVFGSENTDDPSTFHFPGWHEDTADWLVKKRKIHVLGVDTPSTDYGRSTTYRVHVIIGSKNITGAENVANLDAVPQSGCVIYVTAIKLYDGSGAPARIIATCTEDGMTDSAPTYFPHTSSILYTVLLGYLLI